MYGISAAFQAALLRSHVVATRAEVLDPYGTVLQTLAVVSGSVTVDRTQPVRRRCTVTLTDVTGTLVPAAAGDLLHPTSGNEVKLYRGIAATSLGTTADELVPLGVFRMGKVAVRDDPDSLTISVEGYDRARRVQRARFTAPYVIAAGTNYATAIGALLTSRYPGVVTDLMSTTRTTPQLIFDEGGDPWASAMDMAQAIGAEVFFNADGVAVLRAVPDPFGAPVWTYAEGAQAVVLDVARDLDDEHTYNHVIVTGEKAENVAPVRAEASDTNPSSPTYVSRYGDVPYFYTSKFLTSTAQAQDVADAMLRTVLGAAESVEFTGLVNPAHDTGDVVRVTRSRVRVDANYLLDRFTVPLGHDQPMPASTRRTTS